MELGEIRFVDVYWINMGQNVIQWWTYAKTAMKLPLPQKSETFC